MTSEFTIAVHSLVYLYHHVGMVYSSEALAENVCTNAARIRKVMSRLKKAGFVETKEGIEGGCHAEEKCGSVTLCQVAEALGVSFVSAGWRSGSPEKNCLIASGMADVISGIYEELDGLCHERLKQITIKDVDKRLFH